MRRWSALVGAIVLLAGCGGASPSAPTPADIDAIDVTPTQTITVDEDGFDPRVLEVGPGEVIRLVNGGDEPHSFTAVDRFDTGLLDPSDDTTLVLTDPGEIVFHDSASPDHEGTLTVTEARAGQ